MAELSAAHNSLQTATRPAKACDVALIDCSSSEFTHSNLQGTDMLAMTQEPSASRVRFQPALPKPRAKSPDPRSLEDYLSRGTVRGIEAKEHLFAEGDAKSSIYRVLSGALCLYKILPDGRRQVIDFAYAGDVIGLESGIVATYSAQSTVATRVSCLPSAILDRAAANDPRIAMQLYMTMARNVDAMRDHLVCVGQRSATERLVSFLLGLSRRRASLNGGTSIVELPMTRTDIADFLGLTIETVSRTLSKLKAQRCIEIDQGTTIRFVDIVALEALAEGEAR